MGKEKNQVAARSERLYLSPLNAEHAAAYMRWYNDPEIFGHIREMAYQTNLEEQRRWVEETNRDPTQKVFSVFYIPDDRLIGDGGFMHINWEDKKAEIGLVIGEKKYWNMGLGKELRWLLCQYGFEVLGFHNILGEHFANNPVSLQNALKTGAKIMGTRRESKLHYGVWLDTHYTDMLPHELIKPNKK
jgi:RimJ/RimL family protein N-acetyltransferase